MGKWDKKHLIELQQLISPLPPLCCLPINSDDILSHVINVNQSDFAQRILFLTNCRLRQALQYCLGKWNQCLHRKKVMPQKSLIFFYSPLSLKVKIQLIIDFPAYNRHLKIPGQDELQRLPELNLLNWAWVQEFLTHLSAVLVLSRTPFLLFSRNIENMSILHLFWPYNYSNRLYFQLYW